MSNVFTFGYGNRGIEVLHAILAERPNTVVIDTRRFPKGWSAVWARPYLEKNVGDRYQFQGTLLGNGHKGEEKPGASGRPGHVNTEIAPGWAANEKDWWKLDCWTTRAKLAPVPFLIAGLQDIRGALGNREPIFMCAEKLHTSCHRTPVANFAVEHVWTGAQVVHL